MFFTFRYHCIPESNVGVGKVLFASLVKEAVAEILQIKNFLLPLVVYVRLTEIDNKSSRTRTDAEMPLGFQIRVGKQ